MYERHTISRTYHALVTKIEYTFHQSHFLCAIKSLGTRLGLVMVPKVYQEECATHIVVVIFLNLTSQLQQ